ncbi:hypothetical protein [Candidatus Berkiella aquae]|uniref:Uncharacterized protein n=1 Tax=Candidatus Berkiella aquae TaxID=295108 RepID=A0A0Q9YUY9_9GAMM|nr:hypothetical protein [Candidatus Berkiella aquae]MCS5710658.1 hypothetical protein [Candidatus Berkiella aquae]
MIGNNIRQNDDPSSEELDYPLENLLTKVIGRLTVMTGWCFISVEAFMNANPCALVVAAYGAHEATDCIDATADTCCPPIRRQATYRPIEMDLLETGRKQRGQVYR